MTNLNAASASWNRRGPHRKMHPNNYPTVICRAGSNITDTVCVRRHIGDTYLLAKRFHGTNESVYVLDTAQLDFDIQVNSWSQGS